MRAVHAQTARYFIDIARMLQKVAPTAEEQQVFLRSPQPDLHGKTPRQVMLDDAPFGAREVYDLLGRIVYGIPA